MQVLLFIFTPQRQAHVQVLYDSRGQNGAGSPLEFDTGVDAVPEAVDMCIRLMVPSEIASVTAAAKYAYEGRMDIPEVGHMSACLCNTSACLNTAYSFKATQKLPLQSCEAK